MSRIVMKFGGTSVANLSRIKNLQQLVKNKILSGHKKIIVVVSAMSGVTNSLVKQYQELFKLDGAKLTFNDNAIKEIALKAIRKKTGARGLRSIMENVLLKTMYDLPSQENIEEVIIDSSTVKGQSQPIIVHSKTDNKSKSNKTTAA